MKNDINILRQILLDKKYTDKFLLEFELNKVSDKRLVIGFLFEVYAKESHKANKEVIKDLFANFCDSKLEEDVVIEYHTLFKNNLLSSLESNHRSLKRCLLLYDILLRQPKDMLTTQNDEFVKTLKESDEETIKLFEEFLLSKELYEVLSYIKTIKSEINSN